jgi:hypothetical protein
LFLSSTPQTKPLTSFVCLFIKMKKSRCIRKSFGSGIFLILQGNLQMNEDDKWMNSEFQKCDFEIFILKRDLL